MTVAEALLAQAVANVGAPSAAIQAIRENAVQP